MKPLIWAYIKDKPSYTSKTYIWIQILHGRQGQNTTVTKWFNNIQQKSCVLLRTGHDKHGLSLMGGGFGMILTLPRGAPPAVYIGLYVVQQISQRVFNHSTPTHVTYLMINRKKNLNYDLENNQHQWCNNVKQLRTLQIVVLQLYDKQKLITGNIAKI